MGSEHTEGKETKWRETFQASRIQHQHQNKTLKSNNVERLKRVNQRKEDDIISYKVQNYGVLKMKFLFEKMNTVWKLSTENLYIFIEKKNKSCSKIY